jgi:hypothetical protein
LKQQRAAQIEERPARPKNKYHSILTVLFGNKNTSANLGSFEPLDDVLDGVAGFMEGRFELAI